MRKMFSKNQIIEMIGEVLDVNPAIEWANSLKELLYVDDDTISIDTDVLLVDGATLNVVDWSCIIDGKDNNLENALDAKQDALTNELDTDTLVTAVGFNADGELVKGAVGSGGGSVYKHTLQLQFTKSDMTSYLNATFVYYSSTNTPLPTNPTLAKVYEKIDRVMGYSGAENKYTYAYVTPSGSYYIKLEDVSTAISIASVEVTSDTAVQM